MEAQIFIDYHYSNHAKEKSKIILHKKKKEILVIINVLIKRDI